MAQELYHRNVADGSSVKGVECKFCGEYVGLVQSKKTGKWYTCQLVRSMNPDSFARNAYPFLPHFPECKVNQERRRLREEWHKKNGYDEPIPPHAYAEIEEKARAARPRKTSR